MFVTDNISVNIMCVILCLFSALSRRVRTLQISIIFIIIATITATTMIVSFHYSLQRKHFIIIIIVTTATAAVMLLLLLLITYFCEAFKWGELKHS